MSYDDNKISDVAKKMGDNLRAFRIKGGHGTQATMAFRIGVSEGTYAKMEQGNPSVSMATWLSAATLFNKEDALLNLMSSSSLFDRVAEDEKVPQRFRHDKV